MGYNGISGWFNQLDEKKHNKEYLNMGEFGSKGKSNRSSFGSLCIYLLSLQMFLLLYFQYAWFRKENKYV